MTTHKMSPSIHTSYSIAQLKINHFLQIINLLGFFLISNLTTVNLNANGYNSSTFIHNLFTVYLDDRRFFGEEYYTFTATCRNWLCPLFCRSHSTCIAIWAWAYRIVPKLFLLEYFVTNGPNFCTYIFYKTVTFPIVFHIAHMLIVQARAKRRLCVSKEKREKENK